MWWRYRKEIFTFFFYSIYYAIFEFKNAGQGEDVSGLYSVIYSANLANIGSPEDVNGLPCKVYLEHVAGDHSKRYSFIILFTHSY